MAQNRSAEMTSIICGADVQRRAEPPRLRLLPDSASHRDTERERGRSGGVASPEAAVVHRERPRACSGADKQGWLIRWPEETAQ